MCAMRNVLFSLSVLVSRSKSPLLHKKLARSGAAFHQPISKALAELGLWPVSASFCLLNPLVDRCLHIIIGLVSSWSVGICVIDLSSTPPLGNLVETYICGRRKKTMWSHHFWKYGSSSQGEDIVQSCGEQGIFLLVSFFCRLCWRLTVLCLSCCHMVVSVLSVAVGWVTGNHCSVLQVLKISWCSHKFISHFCWLCYGTISVCRHMNLLNTLHRYLPMQFLRPLKCISTFFQLSNSC